MIKDHGFHFSKNFLISLLYHSAMKEKPWKACQCIIHLSQLWNLLLSIRNNPFMVHGIFRIAHLLVCTTYSIHRQILFIFEILAADNIYQVSPIMVNGSVMSDVLLYFSQDKSKPYINRTQDAWYKQNAEKNNIKNILKNWSEQCLN